MEISLFSFLKARNKTLFYYNLFLYISYISGSFHNLHGDNLI